MNKILISYAIESGAWFNCTSRGGAIPYYKIRVIYFKQIRTTASEGIPWLLKLEIVNLQKIPQYGLNCISHFFIVNQDNYKFSSGKYRFSTDNLNPLIKYTADITFSLPDNEGSDYYLLFDDLRTGGKMQEM